MIRNVKVQNYKSHRQVELLRSIPVGRNLGRINLLLGKNNAGKTAMLETLFFLSRPENPQKVLTRLNVLRGYREGVDATDVWNSFFYNWDSSQEISIESSNGNLKQTLRITALKASGQGQTSSTVVESADFMPTTQALSFSYESSTGASVKQTVTSGTLRQAQGGTPQASGDAIVRDGKRQLIPFAPSPVTFLPARGIPNPNQEAQRFSRLEVANRHQEVVAALRIIEPRLKRLLVAATQTGSLLYADLGASRLMPVPLMGDGILRTLSIVLAMINSQGFWLFRNCRSERPTHP